MNLYDVKKIPLSPVEDRIFTAMFYFKDGKRVFCNCPLSDKKLNDWGVVLVFGSGSASNAGYEKLKNERNCLYSEDDAKRAGTTFDILLRQMKKKVADVVERASQEEVSDVFSKIRKDWYSRSKDV